MMILIDECNRGVSNIMDNCTYTLYILYPGRLKVSNRLITENYKKATLRQFLKPNNRFVLDCIHKHHSFGIYGGGYITQFLQQVTTIFMCNNNGTDSM